MNAATLFIRCLLALVSLCASERSRVASAPQVRAKPSLEATPLAQLEPGMKPAIEVELFDAETRQPLPGLEVRATRDTIHAQDLARIDALMVDADAVFTSDERGIVRVPRVVGGLTLAARRGSSWGCMECGWQSRNDVRLDLLPDADLRVQVVDATGAPVRGVPVALCAQRSESPAALIVAQTQGEEGIAILSHASFAIQRSKAMPLRQGLWHGGYGPWRFSVALALVLDKPVQVRFTDDGIPNEPVRLTLPPTGEVEVRCHDFDGSPARIDGPITLRTLTGSAERVCSSCTGVGEWPLSPGGQVNVASTSPRNGSVLFTNVGLDLVLRIDAWRNLLSTPVVREVHGPSRPGERRVVDLALDEGLVVLRGRALGTDRTPITNCELTGELLKRPSGTERASLDESACTDSGQLDRYEFGLGESGPIRTDETGRFTAEFHPNERGCGPFTFALTRARLTREAIGAVRDVESWKVGLQALGDVVLEPLAPLCAGIVENESGTPVAGARIFVLGVLDGTVLSATTDADGLFEIRSIDLRASFAAEVSARSYVPRRVRANRGTLDMRVVLERAGAAQGCVLLPWGMSTEGARVELTRSQGPSVTCPIAMDGSFEFSGAVPGLHTLSVVSGPPERRVLLAARAIEVRPGEPTPLEPIVLRFGPESPR